MIPGVLLISAARHLAGHGAMVDTDYARHVLHDQNLLGPTALRRLTGVLLFASSIAGWWRTGSSVPARSVIA